MMLFATLLLLFLFVYCCGITVFLTGLFRPSPERIPFDGRVSVIVAARNEESTLPDLLSDLTKQTYPSPLYEVIIINDRSTDRTGEVVAEFSRKHKQISGIEVRETLPNLTAKKNALSQGIAQSTGELILTVDADCRVLPTWIESMASYFTPETGLVAGFSQLGRPGVAGTLFERIQALDFLALMAAARGSINMGLAWSASGQNFAYRRSAYETIGGFRDIGHRLSGDDVLLMQLVRRRTKWKIRFADAPGSFNTSKAEKRLSDLLKQRSRWASNGAYQLLLNVPFFLYCVAVFGLNLLILAGLPLVPAGFPAALLLTVLAIKGIFETAIIMKGTSLFIRKELRALLPLWFFWQIPYVVFVGFLGNIGRITWKSRTHQTIWKPGQPK